MIGRAAIGRAAIGRAVVPLLAVAFFFNYADRGSLATAAPFIKDELGLTAVEMGWLLSAFFWSYVPAQILAGWLAERFSPYRTLAFGFAVWSAATAASGVVGGFLTLFCLRVLLGLGESVAYPCSAKLFAQHLPGDRLGRANGLIGVGMALGPAVGTFFGGLLMARLGWRVVFVVLGAISLTWLVPWLIVTPGVATPGVATPGVATPGAHAATAARPGGGASLTSIIRRREVWGASLGQFCGNYAFYFVISWLPLYLVKARGFSVAEMARIGGLVYIVYASSSYLTGRLSDRWIRSGAGVNRVRKTCIVSAHLIMASALVACALGDAGVSIAGLLFAGVGFGFFTPAVYTIGQTLAGPESAGRWMGIQNSIGNLAGVIGPIATGWVIDRTGQYTWAFVSAAGVATAGVLCWGVLIPTVGPLAWPAPAPSPDEAVN